MMKINAKTALYCIFGNPVGHSLSPAMHNALFGHFGINAVYLAFAPDSITEGLAAMRSLGIRGASVTIPFKTAIMAGLDEVDSLARDIGAVNTVVNRGGKLAGFNTDGQGAVRALVEAGIALKGSSTLVIGNGGSARAIAFSLIDEGGSVAIAGRNRERILPLVEDLKKKDWQTGYFILDDLTAGITRDYDVIVNTAPVGMEPRTGDTPLEARLIHEHQIVFDIVYAPEVTRLIGEARAKGCRTVSGKEMLLHQGARQFEMWTGKVPPLEVMRRALDEAGA